MQKERNERQINLFADLRAMGCLAALKTSTEAARGVKGKRFSEREVVVPNIVVLDRQLDTVKKKHDMSVVLNHRIGIPFVDWVPS
jgi:hypothetical protein